MERYSINFNSRIEPKQEINSEFTLCKCYVAATGKNRNMTYIGQDTMDKGLNSLGFCPVVGHLYKDNEGKLHMGGHDMTINEDWELISLTVPYGVVKPDTYSYETIEEYGTEVNYVVADIILWTGRYPELKEAIYSEETYFSQSMEIQVGQYRPLEEDSNYLEILDFEFSALCLLGKSDDSEYNVNPCFINAKVQPYQFALDEEFTKSMNELKDAIAKCFEKEGEELEFTAKDVKIAVEGEAVEFAEDINTAEEIAETEEVETETTETETEEFESETETETEETESGYIPINEDVVPIYTSEITSLIASLNVEIEMLKAENAELVSYKEQVENMNRANAESEVFAKYDNCLGDSSEYAEIKSKSAEYSLEDLDKTCLMLVGKYALASNNKKTETKADTETLVFSVDTTNTITKNDNPYGDVFEKYGNK